MHPCFAKASICFGFSKNCKKYYSNSIQLFISVSTQSTKSGVKRAELISETEKKQAKYFYNSEKKITFVPRKTGCSSARFRVLVWGASGRRFESSHPDKCWEKKDLQNAASLFCYYYLFLLSIFLYSFCIHFCDFLLLFPCSIAIQ